MHKLFYPLAVAGFLMACGSPSGQQAAAASEEDTAAATLAVNGRPGDPICEMPYDTSYHEFSVFKGDTVHFCSATCKEVFDKNPEKYAAKLN